MDIGLRIKELRKRKGLTQSEFAQKANMSRTYLSDVENNRYNPSIETLQNIAKHLGVPIEVLLKEDNNDKISEDSTHEYNPKVKPIIDSLDRAGDLQDEDIDEIARQVKFLIDLKRKKK